MTFILILLAIYAAVVTVGIVGVVLFIRKVLEELF